MPDKPHNKNRRNSTIAAFGFVGILVILIVSAANYIRIQEPRFQREHMVQDPGLVTPPAEQMQSEKVEQSPAAQETPQESAQETTQEPLQDPAQDTPTSEAQEQPAQK